MNRRQFLSHTAAGILAVPTLLRGAGAQEGPFRTRYYPVAAGMGSRDVAPARDGTVWFCGQRNGRLGGSIPATARSSWSTSARAPPPTGS